MPEKKSADVDVPATLKRSPKKARDTYAKTLESAETEYRDEGRAHRTAWGAVKHSFEKVGDHWEPKEGGHRGPSDPQSAKTGAAARRSAGPGESLGGVDAQASRSHLLELAKRAGIAGRSRMTKDQLAAELQKSNDRATRRAR